MNNLWFIYLLSSIGKAEEDLDVFENDGFAVDDAEDDEEEEGENTKQAQNKKKKRGYYTFLPCYAFSYICIVYSSLCAFATHFQEIIEKHCSWRWGSWVNSWEQELQSRNIG